VTGGWTMPPFHGWTDGSLIQSTGGTRNHRCPEEIHRMQAVDGGVGVRLWSIFSSLKLKVGYTAFGRPKSIGVYINLSVAFNFSLLFEFDQQ